MNRALWIVLIVAVLGLACFSYGCNGVYLNKEYSAKLDAAASQASIDADLVKAGALTPTAVTASLDARTADWLDFKAASKRTIWLFGPVYFSPTAATLWDECAGWTQDAADRSRKATYTDSSRIEALRIEASLWRKFVKARDGKKD